MGTYTTLKEQAINPESWHRFSPQKEYLVISLQLTVLFPQLLSRLFVFVLIFFFEGTEIDKVIDTHGFQTSKGKLGYPLGSFLNALDSLL